MIAKTRTIADTKKLLGEKPTIRFVDPKFVYLAMGNARCPKAELFIKEGDHVNMCQVIGMRHAAFFDQPIHATVSGTFVGLEKHYHRSGKITDFIKIENDFKETLDPACVERSDEEIAKLTKEDMVQILQDTASVGLGGSSFPTHIKFNTDKPIHTILINAIECEPYITSDHRIMVEYPDRIVKGIRMVMNVFNVKKALICIKKKYTDLKQQYEKVLEHEEGIDICCVGNFYPQGWEHAMIKSALGINIQPGELPPNYGVLNFNVSTIVGLYTAVKLNQPVIDRNISITGDGVAYPCNFRIKVGTSVKELIEKCGGYLHPEIPKVFILGGPMMGASLPSDDCICTKTVTSIIVLNETKEKEEPCVRCGSCTLSCPVGLQPVLIMNAVKTLDKDRIKALNPLKCIECGLCTYSCTSKIRVTDFVRKAKVFAKLP